MKNFLILIFSIALSACASEGNIRNRDLMTQGTDSVVNSKNGLVFGEQCGGGGFSAVAENAPEQHWSPGRSANDRFFFMSLPAGHYKIPSIGSVHGAFEGKPPLEFTVVPAKITYIGAIYPSWWRAGDGREKCQYDWPTAVRSRIYEFSALIGKNLRWEVYVLNRGEIAAKAIQQEYPKIDFSSYRTDLVK